MKHRAFIAAIALLASLSSADVFAARAAKQKPAAREPDMCVVPPGAQPLLPAKLLPGMGTIKDFAVTTKSEDARKFFLQGLAQIHSFWFVESERSCLQAAQLDPEMAMAYWCMALSAASDYRPAFQLLRNAAAVEREVSAARLQDLPAPLVPVLERLGDGGLPLSELTDEQVRLLRERSLADDLVVRWTA